MNEIDEVKIQEMIDETLRKGKETMEIIRPIFNNVIDLSIPSDFYTRELEYILSYYNPDKPFYGCDYMGWYDAKSECIDIDIKSEKGFDLFFDVFPTAPKIDIAHINQVINEFRFMYAFILGKDMFHQVTTMEDIKDNYRWDGENYRFTVRLLDESIFDQEHFSIKVFYDICTKTCKINQSYKYEFMHPDIAVSFESFDSIAFIKESFFQHVAKMMNKTVNEIRLIDYKLLPMLNC